MQALYKYLCGLGNETKEGDAVITKESRYRGCLMGKACVDALGQHVEFKSRGSYELLTEFKSGGTWGLKAGTWTDDTSMALCLADSLLTCNGFDAKHQLETYTRWYQKGYLSATNHCFDIGGSCRAALHRFETTGETKCENKNAAGNGSLMRLAPVALFYGHDLNVAAHCAGASSLTTHGSPEATDACRVFAAMIVTALHGGDKAELRTLSVKNPWMLKTQPKIAAIVRGDYRNKDISEISGDGYVVSTLEAALWCFEKTDSFEAGAIECVNLGLDTDSVGAVYGALAGAFYGYEAIPARWRDNLVKKELVLDFADRLCAVSRFCTE